MTVPHSFATSLTPAAQGAKGGAKGGAGAGGQRDKDSAPGASVGLTAQDIEAQVRVVTACCLMCILPGIIKRRSISIKQCALVRSHGIYRNALWSAQLHTPFKA